MGDNLNRKNPSGVMAKELDFDIVTSEFELQSHYYIPFRTNILTLKLNNTIKITSTILLYFSGYYFGIKQPKDVYINIKQRNSTKKVTSGFIKLMDRYFKQISLLKEHEFSVVWKIQSDFCIRCLNSVLSS